MENSNNMKISNDSAAVDVLMILACSVLGVIIGSAMWQVTPDNFFLESYNKDGLLLSITGTGVLLLIALSPWVALICFAIHLFSSLRKSAS